MKKSINGVRKTSGRHILQKTREVGETAKKVEEIITIKEDIKNSEIVPEENKIGCFQLVVIEKVPWYKKITKTIFKFFTKRYRQTC